MFSNIHSGTSHDSREGNVRITNVNVGVLAKEGAGPDGDASPVAVLPLRLDSRLGVELCPGSGTLPVPKLL